MSQALSDVRIARSVIGHTTSAGTAQTQEMDFDFGVQEAIEIFGVQGLMLPDISSVASSVSMLALQTLHLEDDALTTVPDDDGDADLFETDSEIAFMQELHMLDFDGTTEAHASAYINPTGLIVFPEPILSAANMTHRTVCDHANLDFAGTLLVHYRYVKLSFNELAFAIARRGR